jgi:hypothetical protein
MEGQPHNTEEFVQNVMEEFERLKNGGGLQLSQSNPNGMKIINLESLGKAMGIVASAITPPKEQQSGI